MNDRPTYPEILKLFYKYSFPDQLGAPASAVAQAIIYKSNELWFPASFEMSNKELSQLSGEKQSNIGRTRQKVLETCVIDGNPLFTYVSNGTQKSGRYTINFNLCSTLTSTCRQKQAEIDNDPNTTLPNKTDLPPTPQNVSTKQEQQEDEVELGEVDELIKHLKEKFQLPTDPPYSIVNGMLYRYGLSPIVDAIDVAKPNSKNWRGILAYIDPIAKKIGAQSRGISGERLDAMEKEYRDLIYELEVAKADLETGQAELTPGDKSEEDRLKEGKEWLENREQYANSLAAKIELYGGNTEVRR